MSDYHDRDDDGRQGGSGALDRSQSYQFRDITSAHRTFPPADNTSPQSAELSGPHPPFGQGEGPDVDGLGPVRTLLREIFQIVAPAVLLAFTIHLFLAQATVVYGQSMQPNLRPHERLVIEKVSYYLHAPQRNDIVVLDMPAMSELLIKRVVGLPGETITIRSGLLFVDGVAVDQPYARTSSTTNYGPVTLPALTYFVMGDNRNNSNDSRSFGPIHRQEITGRAWLRYWPMRRFTVFP